MVAWITSHVTPVLLLAHARSTVVASIVLTFTA